MVFSHLTLTRFIQVYIVQGFVVVYFTYLVFKIYKGKIDKQTTIFSGFYISVIIAFVINFIYAPMTDPNLVKNLHYITTFFILFSVIFLMVFCLTTFKGEENVSSVKQLTMILVYGVLLSLMVIIPNGVKISADTGWHPHWSVSLFIYLIILVSAISIGPSYYYAIRIYKIIGDTTLKNKWMLFIVGLIVLNVLLYGTMYSNTLHNPLFRTIWAFISLFLAFSSSHLIYYGIGSKLK